MSDQPEKTPLIDLLADVPEGLRAEWPCQWFEDGTPSGHTMSPIGKHIKEAVELIQSLQAQLDKVTADSLCCCEFEANKPECFNCVPRLQSQLTEANKEKERRSNAYDDLQKIYIDVCLRRDSLLAEVKELKKGLPQKLAEVLLRKPRKFADHQLLKHYALGWRTAIRYVAVHLNVNDEMVALLPKEAAPQTRIMVAGDLGLPTNTEQER
jgi:hypothetical protein